MTLYIRPLTATEQAAVAQALRSHVTLTYRRARIISLSAAGRRPAEIAASVGLHIERVRVVLREANRGELAPLLAPRPGRRGPKPRLGEAQLPRLLELLHHSPAEYGLATERWTLRDLAQMVVRQGITAAISPSQLWRVLVAGGCSWRQAKRRMTSPDPEYAEKRGSVSSLSSWSAKIRRGRCCIMTRAGMWGGLGKAAAGVRGQPRWIPAVGPTRGQVLYLSREAASDELFWSWRPAARSEETLAHLAELGKCYRGKRYLVISWDNASWHTSRKVRDWLGEYNRKAGTKRLPRLLVYPLPTYSPWLNPTEAVFSQNKRRSLFGENQPDAETLRHRVEANLCYFHPKKSSAK